jgi:hypothetical protein
MVSVLYSIQSGKSGKERRQARNQNLCCVLGTNAVHEGSPPQATAIYDGHSFPTTFTSKHFHHAFWNLWFQQAGSS